jgi:hypothetical protein
MSEDALRHPVGGAVAAAFGLNLLAGSLDMLSSADSACESARRGIAILEAAQPSCADGSTYDRAGQRPDE